MLLETQFLVTEENLERRREFYNYMKSKGFIDNIFYKSEERIVNNLLPFRIDLDKKGISVSESITCLAVCQQLNLIINNK